MKTMLLLFALLAQTTDHETHYHEAYVLEVIDGKIDAAAMQYLELLRDPKLPPHLAVQCRFRFAVTCVLLGRADEARARLAGLAADPATPKALLPQIEEYRKSLRDVETGRELDKSLEGLKLKLAQAHPADFGASAKARREWQVLGKAAVPYLKDLLSHADEQLRIHAFAILCSIDTPGMARYWRSDLIKWLGGEFESYLRRNRSDIGVIEQRLAALDDKELGPWLSRLRQVPFSVAFLEKLAKRGVAPRVISLIGGLESATQKRLLEKWIREGDPALAKLAADRYVSLPDAAPALLGPVCLRLAVERPGDARRNGLARMVAASTPADLMLVLGELVGAGEKTPVVLTCGLVDSVAAGIDNAEFDVRAYHALVRRWLGVLAKEHRHNNTLLHNHVRTVLRRLPPQRAKEWMRELARLNLSHVSPLLYRDKVEVPWIEVAMEVSAPDGRERIAALVVSQLGQGTPFYRRDIARLYPRVVALHPPEEMFAPLREFRHVATSIPDAAPSAGRLGTAARAVALKLVDVVLQADLSAERAAATVDNLFISYEGLDRATESRYLRSVAIPLLEPLTNKLGTNAARVAFTKMAYRLLLENAHGLSKLGDAHATLLAYVRNNFAHLTDWDGFGDVVDLFPGETWVPHAPDSVFAALPDAVVDAALRRLADHEEVVDERVMKVLRGYASRETGNFVFARLLTRVGGPQLSVLMNGRDASWSAAPETLEKLLERGLADSSYSLWTLGEVGSELTTQRPTRKLYPLVRKLLASDSPSLARQGIRFAEQLGQADLLSDLAKLLNSLDSHVRRDARSAIESIRKLEELRAEFKDER